MRRRKPDLPRRYLKLAENVLRYYSCYKAIVGVLEDCLACFDGDAARPLSKPEYIDVVLVLDSARLRTLRIEAALQTLPELDLKVLTAFYINRRKGHVDRLSSELFYEERNIYRLKDRALARFAKAYFKEAAAVPAG